MTDGGAAALASPATLPPRTLNGHSTCSGAQIVKSGASVDTIEIPLALQAFNYEKALLACACGDRDALRELYERDAPWLLGVTLRIVKNRQTAEDLLQEAFLHIWRGAATFDPNRGSGRGWIYTVVRHRALQEIRQGRPELSFCSLDLESLADARQSADAEGLRISSSELEQCLGQLDPERRDCIIQAFIEGLTHEQIAVRLNAPLGTVKTWIRRGLLSLRERLS